MWRIQCFWSLIHALNVRIVWIILFLICLVWVPQIYESSSITTEYCCVFLWSSSLLCPCIIIIISSCRRPPPLLFAFISFNSHAHFFLSPLSFLWSRLFFSSTSKWPGHDKTERAFRSVQRQKHCVSWKCLHKSPNTYVCACEYVCKHKQAIKALYQANERVFRRKLNRDVSFYQF